MAKIHSGLLLAFALGVGFIPASAKADLLGSQLTWQYYAGGGALSPVDGSITGVTSGEFTDTGGIGGTFIEPTEAAATPIFYIEADDTTITFDYSAFADAASSQWSSSPLSLTPTIFNGIAIDFTSGGDFANVSIDDATNMEGFGSSDFSFTSNEIQVNWQGLTFTPSTIVKFDVTLADSVVTSEPGTLSMIVAILLPAFLLVRKAALRRLWLSLPEDY